MHMFWLHNYLCFGVVDAGGPGTGKGTQCGRMVKEFGFKHISLGEILRTEVKNRSQIGKECASIMKAGKLVPLDLTLRLMQNAMEQARDASGYILDGFPRAVNQAKGFTKQVQVTVAQIPSNLLPLS
jgi:adenylate kinase family enzyme